MKKIFTLWIIVALLMNISLTSAELGWETTRSLLSNSVYSSKEAFLEAEWKFCNTATDGINVILLKNGEFTISTMAFTPNPEYSCTSYKLSDNDMNFYNTIQGKLGDDFLNKLEGSIVSYEERMRILRWSDEKRGEAHEQNIQKAEEMIFNLLLKYPQDIALPKNINDLYLKISLVKFELMILDM